MTWTKSNRTQRMDRISKQLLDKVVPLQIIHNMRRISFFSFFSSKTKHKKRCNQMNGLFRLCIDTKPYLLVVIVVGFVVQMNYDLDVNLIILLRAIK